MSQTPPIQQPSSALEPQRYPVSWVFDRNQGKLHLRRYLDDTESLYQDLYECEAYAGRSRHINRASSDHLKGLGPLPGGEYRLVGPQIHPRLGPIAFRLNPYLGNDMKGRGDFWIHGDNSKMDRSASSGCIILARRHRLVIADSRARHLQVL